MEEIFGDRKNKLLPTHLPHIHRESNLNYQLQSIFLEFWGVDIKSKATQKLDYNPSPNPVSLNRETLFNTLQPNEYSIFEKTDGCRYQLMLCETADDKKKLAVMIDRNCRKYEVKVAAQEEFFKGSLFDGELVEVIQKVQQQDSNGKGSIQFVYFVFDAISVKGKKVNHLTFLERMKYVQSCFLTAFDNKIVVDDGNLGGGGTTTEEDLEQEQNMDYLLEQAQSGKIISCGPSSPFHCSSLCFKAKFYYPLSELTWLWNNINNNKNRNVPTDGIIFIPNNRHLTTGTDWNQFKWKWNHTIDLQLRGYKSRPDSDDWNAFGLYYIDTSDESMPENYVNASEEGIEVAGERYTIGFTKPSKSYTIIETLTKNLKTTKDRNEFRCIVECAIEKIVGNKIICRVECFRRDKFLPNNGITVSRTVTNFKEKITIEEILSMTTIATKN